MKLVATIALFLGILGLARAEKTGIDGTLVTEKGERYFPCPFDTWKLNEKTLGCEAPVPRPKGDNWVWNPVAGDWTTKERKKIDADAKASEESREKAAFDEANRKRLSGEDLTSRELQVLVNGLFRKLGN